ncbi:MULTISPECIES: pyroglutamyl-peptidase I [Serratia]|uniref:pyroglutamyl-peptidase I n=1 Tax=Serratia TaxID=613 RepID=UPI000907B183|nr:pyroglutamyl-peptidase I [Serratia marcescens]EIJ6676545.1 pyroglutamyl-peptidase I [Serratia marcescens]HED2348532.1 pyroglutamyl-peptidase I [Serratia marcescens]
MKKLLMISFEPFGGELRNPAWDILSTFKYSDNVEITKIVLPCTYSESWTLLRKKIDQYKYDVALIFAQAGGRWDINIERIAINVNDAPIPDNCGVQPIDEPIEADGKNAYFSTLPVKNIIKNLRDSNIPASISNSSGTFLCNNIFYRLLQYIENNSAMTIAGVVHIPYTPDQVIYRPGVPYMSEEVITRALTNIISTCTSQ